MLMKIKFYSLCLWNLASGLPQIGHELKKRPRHNLLKQGHCQLFLTCFVSVVKFSYWPKFYANIIVGSKIMTILFYKGLTRNPEIENTLV